MPDGTLRRCLSGARFCASCLLTLALWTLWLALVLLLCFQAYIATVNELQVPRFLLHAIEAHLAETGVTVKFGKATFDPSGRVLLQKASFRLESFTEPVVTADAIYLQLDPWALLAKRFEAREIRATGANLFIPAMLSASGRAEKIVQDLDGGFSITSRGDEFSVDYLSCRLGGVVITARGTVNAGTVARNNNGATSLPLAEFLSKNYVALSREFSRAEEQMAGLEGTAITATLTPSDTRGAIVNAALYADGFRMATPVKVEAGQVRARCRFPLLGGSPLMTSAIATAETLNIAGKVSATGLRVRVRGILRMEALTFDPRQAEFTAESVSYGGSSVVAPIVSLVPGPGRTFSADVSALVLGLPVSAHGDVDLAAKSADVTFDGSFSPGLTEPLSDRLGVKVRRFADLREPLLAAGRVRFAPGWKFADVSARVDTRDFTAYHVAFNEARGLVTFDGTHFAAHDAVVVSGDNLAMGSYEQNFSTQEFRYLLTGRLRPLYITPWFGGDWWTGIFKNFDFPVRPPDATIDVRGRYAKGRHFAVYGYAESKEPVLKGVAFDTARALLYVDQFACDGLDVAVTKGSTAAQGSFKLTTEPAQGTWTDFDIEAVSTLDLSPIGKLLPPDAEDAIAAFSFGRPPEVSLRGHFDGPASASPPHKTFHAEVRSGTGFKVHGVAFDRASFKFDLAGDEIKVTDIVAGFAGGEVAGTADVTGAGPDRRIHFKTSLSGASLGQAAEAAEGYVVAGPHSGSTALDTFAKDKSGVRLDLNASGEGRPGELSSFVGDGNVQIQGANLGELSLLGGLSKVLKFPELRFTQAEATFKIGDSAVTFPDLKVIGANSAIRAKGTYQMEQRTLDFSATIYPFAESKSLLQVFNPLTAPLSAMLRVRLSGSIDKPAWRLAYSPLNLLRVDEVKAGASDKVGAPGPVANPAP
jgi:AsmA-like C-terminal region